MNTMNTRLILISVICVSIILCFSACMKQKIYVMGSTFSDIQRIPQGFPYGSSFAISPDKEYNQLFSKEVTRKIAKILEDKGYVVTSPKYADYALFFTCDMTSSKSIQNVPIYTPGQTQTTQGSIYGCKGSVGYEEKTQMSGTTTYVQRQYSVYYKTLKVEVFDAKLYRQAKRVEQLWQGHAGNCSGWPDLRKTLDYLLSSIFRHFGQDINGINDAYDDK